MMEKHETEWTLRCLENGVLQQVYGSSQEGLNSPRRECVKVFFDMLVDGGMSLDGLLRVCKYNASARGVASVGTVLAKIALIDPEMQPDYPRYLLGTEIPFVDRRVFDV